MLNSFCLGKHLQNREMTYQIWGLVVIKYNNTETFGLELIVKDKCYYYVLFSWQEFEDDQVLEASEKKMRVLIVPFVLQLWCLFLLASPILIFQAIWGIVPKYIDLGNWKETQVSLLLRLRILFDQMACFNSWNDVYSLHHTLFMLLPFGMQQTL